MVTEGVCEQWGRARCFWAFVSTRDSQMACNSTVALAVSSGVACSWAVPCVGYLDSHPRHPPWQGDTCKSMCFPISCYSFQAVSIRWAVENLGAWLLERQCHPLRTGAGVEHGLPLFLFWPSCLSRIILRHLRFLWQPTQHLTFTMQISINLSRILGQPVFVPINLWLALHFSNKKNSIS